MQRGCFAKEMSTSIASRNVVRMIAALIKPPKIERSNAAWSPVGQPGGSSRLATWSWRSWGDRQHLADQVPWHKTSSTRRREILAPRLGDASSRPPDPFRRVRALLVASIARGRRWLDELTADPERERRNHCRARVLQYTQDQYDDLARFPRARSRQSRHRWSPATRHGRGAALRTARRTGPASAAYSA